jgi:hypothetical protein
VLEVLTFAVLLTAAFAQSGENATDFQKPFEEKQGGEYSGFEETGRQDQGLPNDQANPIPQAPSTGVEADGNTQTETADTFVEPSRPSSWPLLAGAGIAAMAGVGIAVWYFRGRSRKT